MKQKAIQCMAVLLLLTMANANAAENDIKIHPKCKYSGMDRDKFSHSRILIRYEDGTEVGTGSLRCASIDLAVNFMKTVKSVLVGDYTTRRLIDAEKAYWVTGGNVKGVMTRTPKWAFAGKNDALAFIAANGGKLTGYKEALRATYSDMIDDTAFLHDMMKGMKGHNSGHGDTGHQNH